MMKPKPIFLLDSDSNISYSLVDKLVENKEEDFLIYFGCTNDRGIETFKLGKTLIKKGFPKERTYLFPGDPGQAFSSIFCNKTLVPEVVNGKYKDNLNKEAFLGKLVLKALGQKTLEYDYIITSRGSSVSKKAGIERILSDYDIYSYARKIAKQKKAPEMVYIEAGSGSDQPIARWKDGINGAYEMLSPEGIKLNIGGGINKPEQLKGISADRVVISTSIEKNSELIAKFIKYSKI